MAEQLLLGNAPQPLPPMVTCWSMYQPFAGLVAARLKDETRTFEWPVKARPYPAPLLICATVKWVGWPAYVRQPMAPICLDGGVALCLVDIVGCRELVEADLPRSWYWEPEKDRLRGKKRYLWMTANVRRVAPFIVKGLQGFARTVPRAQVEAALKAWEVGHA